MATVPPSQLELRPLAAEDTESTMRLHKFAKYKGQPVFGSSHQRGIHEMVDAACTGSHDAFGYAAVESSSGEGEDMVGAVCFQWAEGRTVCVLLTLVVRADERKRGVGRRLLGLVEKACMDAGCKLVVTDVAASNDAAVGFFRRAGFAAAARPPKTSKSVELQKVLASAAAAAAPNPHADGRHHASVARCRLSRPCPPLLAPPKLRQLRASAARGLCL